jgi:hypothetical protein
MIATLQALTLYVFAAASTAFARGQVPHEVANAIAIAVVEDGPNAPVFESHALDAAVLAQIVVEESSVQLLPRSQSWDAHAGVSCGPFQERCDSLPTTLVGQARKALWLLHRGRELCPESAVAPYLGGTGARCRAGLARRIGDRRVARARALLSAWMDPGME